MSGWHCRSYTPRSKAASPRYSRGMRIALTGASGFIGAAIARRLHQDGHLVQGLVRESSRRDHVDSFMDRAIVGTHDSKNDMADLIGDADALVHNSVDWKVLKNESFDKHLQTNLVASLQLFELAADAGIPIVYISSVAVHHHMSDRWNGNVDELHPTRPGNYYGALKASLEAHLWALHTSRDLTFASLRPAAVYGLDPHIKRSIGFPILRDIASKHSYERTGGGKFIHVDDVAACVAASLERPRGSAGIYHLADCYARWADWGLMSAELLGVEATVDQNSPTSSKNTFTKDALKGELGVSLDRGHEGIREHLATLMHAMQEQDLLTPVQG